MRIRAYDEELVAAEPSDGVAVADAALDTADDLDEDEIAGAVTALVVDELEVVEVQEDDPDR